MHKVCENTGRFVTIVSALSTVWVDAHTPPYVQEVLWKSHEVISILASASVSMLDTPGCGGTFVFVFKLGNKHSCCVCSIVLGQNAIYDCLYAFYVVFMCTRIRPQ